MEESFWKCPSCFNYVRSSLASCPCFADEASRQQESEGAHFDRFPPTDSRFLQQESDILQGVHPTDNQGEGDHSQNIFDSGLSSEVLNMNSDLQNYSSNQRLQCLPSIFDSHQENGFVPSNPIHHINFRSSQTIPQMYNDAFIPQQSSVLQLQNKIKKFRPLNSSKSEIPQPKVNSFASVSEERSYFRKMQHENRNTSDSNVSNQHFSFDNHREFQPPTMPHQTEKIGHSIPQISGVWMPYQDHPQALNMQPPASVLPFPAQFSQERDVSNDINFVQSNIEFGQPEISNIEATLKEDPNDEYSDNANTNNSEISNQTLTNELYLSLQYLQEYRSGYSSQPHQGDQQISDELQEIFNVQAGIPDPRQSEQVQAGSSIQDTQQSKSHVGENLFQGEFHGEHSQLSHKGINNSTFSNQYFVNDQMPLNQESFPFEKLYRCNICGESFTASTNLKIHKRTHTKERSHICEICGKSFAYSSHLIIHKRTHTQEKPYLCEICGKRFAQNSTLNYHKRTHTTDRPYRCNICGASFALSSYVKSHMRTHTKDRPYLCEICGKSFTRSNTLIAHKQTHKKEDKSM